VARFLTGISIGPANEAGQTWTFAVTSTANVPYAVAPAVATNGTFTFRTAANSFGTNTITVVMTDSGGTNNGGMNKYTNSFNLVVLPVNDPPTFTFSTNKVFAFEDAPLVTVSNFLASMKAGISNENNQTWTFAVTTTTNVPFAVAPAISADGTLTFMTATNAMARTLSRL